jgi:hypothetical protein
VKSVAPGNVVAVDLLRPTFVPEADLRFLRLQVMHRDVIDLEQQRSSVSQAAGDQILHDLLLAVDGHPFVHQGLEIDAMEVAVDADVDPPMQHALALQALAYSYISKQVGSPMLDQSRADSVLDIIAAAIFDDDRFNALQMQQSCQHQTGRPCSDNSNLSAHDWLSANSSLSL